MILIGGDLASRSGLCWGRPDRTPQTKTFKAPVTGQEYGPWGAFWWRVFYNLLDEIQAIREPGERVVAVYESPWIPTARFSKAEGKMVGGTTIATTRKLQGLTVLFETVCELHVCRPEVYEVDVKTIKKELSGSGNADKGAMVIAARRAGVVLPDGDEAMDAADSFGAWLVGVRYHAPEFRDYWDQRINGADRLI